jgi:hypothetical protein
MLLFCRYRAAKIVASNARYKSRSPSACTAKLIGICAWRMTYHAHKKRRRTPPEPRHWREALAVVGSNGHPTGFWNRLFRQTWNPHARPPCPPIALPSPFHCHGLGCGCPPCVSRCLSLRHAATTAIQDTTPALQGHSRHHCITQQARCPPRHTSPASPRILCIDVCICLSSSHA